MELLGKTLVELDQLEVDYRIIKKNGQWLGVTRDYKPDRINIEIKDNIVITIFGNG